MNAYGLGRIFVPDDRDQRFLMARKLAGPTEPLPVKKTWRFRGGALDQGDTGTCVGNGWEGFLHAEPIEPNATELDAQAIYRAARLIDGDDPNDLQAGSSVRAGAQAVTKSGKLTSYLWAFNTREMAEWILRFGPVVAGTDWMTSMFQPTVEGFVKITPTATIAGGHCYLVRGANTKQGVFTCTNSWGYRWGKRGHFYMSFEDMETLMHRDGEAATAIQQRVKAAA